MARAMNALTRSRYYNQTKYYLPIGAIMNPALTVKSQVTIPKAIREFLGVGPGERVTFEPLPDGRVAIASAVKKPKSKKSDCPFEAMVGKGNRKITTDELMRMTRGDDWNQA